MSVAYQYCTGRVDVYVGPPFNAGRSKEKLLSPGEITAAKASVKNKSNPYPGIPPQASAASYLGTCEQYPIVQGGQNWNPWFADITGNMEPADYEYMNEYKIVSLDMNKFVQSVMTSVVGGSQAQIAPSAIGLLQQANISYFGLWLLFGNFGTAAAMPGLPPGEFYPCCRVVNNGYGPMGTRTRNTHLVIRTTPLLRLSDRTTFVFSINPIFFNGLPAPDR